MLSLNKEEVAREKDNFSSEESDYVKFIKCTEMSDYHFVKRRLIYVCKIEKEEKLWLFSEMIFSYFRYTEF